MKRSIVVGVMVVALGAGLLAGTARGTAPIAPGGAGVSDLPLPLPTDSGGLPSGLPSLPLPTSGSPSGSPSPSSSPSGGPTAPGGTIANCPKTSGTTVTFCFDPHFDKQSWYWQEQQVQTVPGTGQKIQLNDPESATTLPVTAQQGQPDRISALQFNLLSHGIPDNVKITSFVLTIEEGTTPTGPEQPEYNSTGKAVDACKIAALWAGADDASLWSNKPQYDANTCVKGTATTSTDPNNPGVFWKFDLTPLATDWGTNPFLTNNGVMFVPVIPSGATPADGNYQINLKIPDIDNQATPTNEYDSTKGRTMVTMTYQGGASTHPPTTTPPNTTPPATTPPPTTAAPPPPVSGGGSNPPSSGGGGIPPGSGTTGGNGGGGLPVSGGGGAPSGPAPVPVNTPAPVITNAAPAAAIPTAKIPWYVWILLPVGLLALAAVRSVLFEQAHGGVRPGGVIAAIRSRNDAARSGGGGGGLLARARAAAKEAKEGLGRGKAPETT